MSDHSFNPKSFLKSLTDEPGIYQMLNAEGDVIYVGKARNLKKRVTSYFQKRSDSAKTTALVKQIHHIDVIVTETENEALLLENTLIKKLKPRYNILFRDDKSYPYIFLSQEKEYPRIDFHRGAKQEKGFYFGPFPSTVAVRETLNLLQKIFKIRQCSDSFFKNRTRPCLQYYIKRCTAPCVKLIDVQNYQQDVQHAKLFLEGKNQEVMHALVEKMESASQTLHFEQAALYRDQLAHLRHIQERQYVSKEGGDADVIAAIIEKNIASVQILFIRAGRLLGHKAYFPRIPLSMNIDDLLTSFIEQHYLNTTVQQKIPTQILVNAELKDKDWLCDVLTEQAKQTIKISYRVRAERAKWLQLAIKNAKQALQRYLAEKSHIEERFIALQEALQLDNIPQRIECFDISHTMGEATVASCVVFDQAGALKNDYRRFNITDITPGDDYGAMREALLRHYTRLKQNEKKLPDILLIDGGKGQLHQAELVLTQLQITGILLVGVAKGTGRKPGLETLHFSNKKSRSLPHDSLALHLIQQIRDEAHRFAIMGHRQQRRKARSQSRLEDIPGVGAKRRRELLRYLGGLQELQTASVDALASVPGISRKLAERIYAVLHPN